MEKPRVLSGDTLVAKGITKIDASLPEVGLKDVTPNGSWLEQKQIQSALEGRKYLIEVERIEKCGTLSHAEWRDDLMLAEVTQKAGGHWQYLGHNVGKTLYLRPEETLFLMEVNCLLLKHNEVTVSLQKAYSLLLRSSTTMTQYKVYASLSRLGYRLFRHAGPKVDENSKNNSQTAKSVDSDVPAPMDDESKHSGSPTANITKSECVNSPVSTVNKTQKLDKLTYNTVTESENDSPLATTLNKSENDSSQIENTLKESENADSSEAYTAVMPQKSESGESIDNTVSDSKSEKMAIVDTVPDSDIDDNIEDPSTPFQKSGNLDSPITNKVTENEQELTIEPEKGKVSEINGNINETFEIKHSEKIAKKLNVENCVAPENTTSNIMEIDKIPDLKTVDLKTTQEVSSTVTEINTNVENTTENMEICTENQETGIVFMEESVHKSNVIEAALAEKPNDMEILDVLINPVKVINKNDDAIGDADLTTKVERESSAKQTIENTKCFENLPNNNDPCNTNMCTYTENITHKVYKDNDPYSYLSKIEKIRNRQQKPSDSTAIDSYFQNIPDLSKERVATINVPKQQLIPKNIFVNKAAYTLNLENIKMRSVRSASSESPAYTSSDEVNGTNIRRIRSSLEASSNDYSHNQNFNPHARFPNFPRFQNFRPYGFWRPQNNLNFYQLMFFQTRVQYHQRPHNLSFRPPSLTVPRNLYISNNARKKIRNGKFAHFQGIRNLAIRMKQSPSISGTIDMSNLETLHSLLHSYNLRYKTRLRLTENFDVVNEEKIVETIELDDDTEPKSKKPRVEKDDDYKFDENLYRLRQLASRLRDLETKDKSTASHRRAFSKAIKTFNKSYNADIYLDDINYEVIDRRCITLDSSSESECAVEEQPQVRSKKLRNPFNILKRRKERMQSLHKPSTSKDDTSLDPNQIDTGAAETDKDSNKYSECILKTFNETWLPNEKDFGRAEVVPKRLMKSRLEFTNKEQFLYEYKNDEFQNWSEAKISFLRCLEETNIAFKKEQARLLADVELCNTGLKPLIDFEDSSDMPSVLEKLRIIENNKEVDIETKLRIDFDVYNRNVQNFRKRNPPKPHFRIICLDESSGVPSAAHVMSLHSKYEDDVPIGFAIVGIGSISYLQINPIDLPIYVPSHDVV